MSRHHHSRHHSYKSYHPRHHSHGGYLKIILALLLIFVLYMLLFNPPLPKNLLPILSPIIYITEFLILVFGLVITTGISRHGVGGSLAMIILGVILIFFGLAWLIASGFSPPAYHAYEILFGIVLGLIGFFTSTYAMLFGQSIIHVR